MELDKKEMTKLDKMTDDDGFMDRGEFMDYAKKSSAVKEFTDKSVGGKKTSTSSHCVNIDKAELAFKVRGYKTDLQSYVLLLSYLT